MYKWFMAWRYLHAKGIAIFAVLCVALCVAMVLAVLSVMGGFVDNMRERSRGLLADIILEAGTLQGWPYYDDFAEFLRQEEPDIVDNVTPTIYNYAVFRVPASTYTKPVRVVGIRIDEYSKTNTFREGLYYENYFPGTTSLKLQRQPCAGYTPSGAVTLPDGYLLACDKWRAQAEAEGKVEEIAEFDDIPFVLEPAIGSRIFRMSDIGVAGLQGEQYPGIIVGSDILNERDDSGAFERFYPRGEPMALTIMPLTPKGNPSSEVATKLLLRYADDSNTGVYEIDSMCVYVEFEMLQHELAMDAQQLIDGGTTRPRATQLLIDLKDGIDLADGKERVLLAWDRFVSDLGDAPSAHEQQLLSFVTVKTWEDMQRIFITALEKEKILMTILFGLISLVAIVLIGCMFYMIVQKKTRDIGVMKSLGASGEGVAGLFILYAGTVGLVGAAIGITMGTTFVWYINDIQDFLIYLDKDLRVWSPEVYTFATIPNVVKVQDAVVVGLVAILSSVLGSIVPASIAGRIWPVQALRYE